MSMSARNGAMIGGVDAVIRKGVNVASGPPKVTLPLLLTQRLECCAPKKSTANGRATSSEEPSSLAGSTVLVQPASPTTAPPARAALREAARWPASVVCAASRVSGVDLVAA